jgi:transcriptional regulator with XRE-family HTH domain
MSLRNRLKRQLRNRQFRHAYADEHLNLSISTQIKAIREMEKMSQTALAEKIGTKQTGISRIESANYDRWSIALLRRLAEAFDLRLRVSFEEFGTLWKEVDTFSRESLERRTFDYDPEFKEATAMAQAAATSHSNVVAIDMPWRIISASSAQSDIRQGLGKMPPNAAGAGSMQEERRA